jgi:hypothetical protein
LSGIERERAPKLSPASTGKRAARGPAHASPQISAAKLQKRIPEFPDSSLVVKAGYLSSASPLQVNSVTVTLTRSL